MEENILQILEAIGLTEGESKAYLALISLGQSSVGHIVEKSGVSASKVYIILDRLVEKGLVTISVEEGVKIYTASSPDNLITLLENEKLRIDENQKKVESILPNLHAKIDSVSKLPLVEFTRGDKGFISAYRRLILSSKDDDTYYALGGYEVSKKMQQHWYEFSVLMSERQVKQQLIYEHDSWFKKDPNIHRRKERKNYYPRYLEKKYKGLPNIEIIGDTMIVNGIEEGEIFTLVVRNKNLSTAFKKMMVFLGDHANVPEGFKKKEIKIN